MNSWYTVASIQILDMKTSLIIFTQTYHIALLRLTCVKTDCLLHRIYWVVRSLSDHIIYEKILLRNSSSQMKNCHFHMNTLVFLSSSQMKKKKDYPRSKILSMKFLHITYSKCKSNCSPVFLLMGKLTANKFHFS